MTASPVFIGADHAGLSLKEAVKDRLTEVGHAVADMGTTSEQSVDYPDFAHRVAGKIEASLRDGETDSRGVLICGTGIGMAIVANRHSGIRAALCGDVFSARMARRHNDANVLCLGARVVGVGLALEITHEFFTTDYEGGRHDRRLGKIDVDGHRTG